MNAPRNYYTISIQNTHTKNRLSLEVFFIHFQTDTMELFHKSIMSNTSLHAFQEIHALNPYWVQEVVNDLAHIAHMLHSCRNTLCQMNVLLVINILITTTKVKRT